MGVHIKFTNNRHNGAKESAGLSMQGARGRLKIFEGRMLMNKKLYTKNYDVKHITLPDGSVREDVVYKGEYYCPQWTPRQKKRTQIFCCVLIAVSIALFALVGLLNNAGSRQYYVLLPFLLTSFPMVFEVFAIFRLLFSSDKMPIDIFHNSLLRLRKSSVAAAGFAALGAIGELVFLLLNPANCAADELMLLLGVAAISAVQIVLFLIIRRVRCTVISNANEAKKVQ